ncbi:MAG: hypothetical protein JXA04_06700 [Gammaproteobacteria bacterium]|nr:hypothetical protein [Gammaproteobacteria bacterium]
MDGVALSADNADDWRANIGYVPQFPYFFDGTLAENVAFGQSTVSAIAKTGQSKKRFKIPSPYPH